MLGREQDQINVTSLLQRYFCDLHDSFQFGDTLSGGLQSKLMCTSTYILLVSLMSLPFSLE